MEEQEKILGDHEVHEVEGEVDVLHEGEVYEELQIVVHMHKILLLLVLREVFSLNGNIL